MSQLNIESAVERILIARAKLSNTLPQKDYIASVDFVPNEVRINLKTGHCEILPVSEAQRVQCVQPSECAERLAQMAERISGYADAFTAMVEAQGAVERTKGELREMMGVQA